MKKFNYEEVGKEIGWDFSKMKHSVECPSGYNYYKEVVKYITPTTKMLDIGCGSAEKATKYYSAAGSICLTDFEPSMLEKARENVEKNYIDMPQIKNKFSFAILDSNGPFEYKDNSFDLVVARHCGANMNEVYRVLKNGGVFVSEDVSEDDCKQLKDYFKRGQGYNKELMYKTTMKNIVDAGFSKIEFLKFEEIEYYKTIDDLKFLLTHTPILGFYEESKDDAILQNYISTHTSSKGIQLNRKLYAFTLVK